MSFPRLRESCPSNSLVVAASTYLMAFDKHLLAGLKLQLTIPCYRVLEKIDAMKYLNFGTPVYLLVFLGLASEVSASSWICQSGKLTREVVVFYPEAPARLPCKVFYSKPKENVVPRALWESKNTHNFCEHKAAEFVEKLSSSGWHCSGDEGVGKVKQ